MEDIYQDMGSDVVLRQAFHSLVSASINEMLVTADWDEAQNWEEGLLFWDEISEEELEDLEKEIKYIRNRIQDLSKEKKESP